MNAPYPPPVYKAPRTGDAEADAAAASQQSHDLQWLADLLDSRCASPARRGALAWMPSLASCQARAISWPVSRALYIISAAARAGVPRHVIVRMVGNIAVDTVVGSVPILGSIFDIAFKSNQRNLRLYAKHAPPKADPTSDRP